MRLTLTHHHSGESWGIAVRFLAAVEFAIVLCLLPLFALGAADSGNSWFFYVPLMTLLVILRQLALRRWACVVMGCLLWYTSFSILSESDFYANLLFNLVPIALTAALTVSCIFGWKQLKSGI